MSFPRNDVPIGFFALPPGTRARVKSCAGGYPLPAGLEDDNEATVIYFNTGSYIVEKNGAVFVVPIACVEENYNSETGTWINGCNPPKGRDSYSKLHRLAASVRKLCGFMHGRDNEIQPVIEGSYEPAQKVGFIGTLAAWKEAVRMA